MWFQVYARLTQFIIHFFNVVFVTLNFIVRKMVAHKSSSDYCALSRKTPRWNFRR